MSFTDMVAHLDSEIATTESRLSRLQTARSALAEEGSTPAPSSAPSTPKRRGPGRPPGSGSNRRSGTRSDQALHLVQERPGITIPELANEMGIEPNYLYRVLPKLAKDKVVKKDGQGWVAVE